MLAFSAPFGSLDTALRIAFALSPQWSLNGIETEPVARRRPQTDDGI